MTILNYDQFEIKIETQNYGYNEIYGIPSNGLKDDIPLSLFDYFFNLLIKFESYFWDFKLIIMWQEMIKSWSQIDNINFMLEHFAN